MALLIKGREEARSDVKAMSSALRKRRQELLSQKKPSEVESIADALIIKQEDIYFVCNRDGQIPMEDGHGLGLYYHDCRFLNGYEFRLEGKSPSNLAATPRKGSLGLVELVCPGFTDKHGRTLAKEDMAIRLERLLEADRFMLLDRFAFRNYTQEPVEFSFSIRFRAGFEDIFAVRKMTKAQLGKLIAPRWRDHTLEYVYEGKDQFFRTVAIEFRPKPVKTSGATVDFRLEIPARQEAQLRVCISISESKGRPTKLCFKLPTAVDAVGLQEKQQNTFDDRMRFQTNFRSDSLLLNRVMDRSLRDLILLRSELNGLEFFAAGTPWFTTLFGRDSLTAALQTLAYEPSIAEQTLRLLARYQGENVDEWRDEQPGKILHELRVGELARCGYVPQSPNYASIDSTMLFIILLARHAYWTGRMELFRELQENVERGLEWMKRHGDLDGDGYLEYDSEVHGGLVNQGWKDSGDAIVNADGSLARPPIALIEVQTYAILARLCAADLFERDGAATRARELRHEARALQRRVDRDFWLEDLGFFALALQADKEPVAVVSSNPGQALWTGVVEENKARRVAERLMMEDMFNGWGIRTLSARERRYNPIAYHLGTIWPHDNSLILAGFRNYGLDAYAQRIFAGITNAASDFLAWRLPEVFAGYPRDLFGVPVRYPVACHPQAWSAGSIPFMVQSLLGLFPDAFRDRLRIIRPVLPPMTRVVELSGLRVGQSTADLRFVRNASGRADVQILKIDGSLRIIVQHADEGMRG